MENIVTDEELVSFLRSIDCNEEDIELIYQNEVVKGYYINFYLLYKDNFDNFIETTKSHR